MSLVSSLFWNTVYDDGLKDWPSNFGWTVTALALVLRFISHRWWITGQILVIWGEIFNRGGIYVSVADVYVNWWKRLREFCYITWNFKTDVLKFFIMGFIDPQLFTKLSDFFIKLQDLAYSKCHLAANIVSTIKVVTGSISTANFLCILQISEL